MISLILSNFAIMIGIFVVIWLISVVIKDASIVDILWGPACAMPAVLTWLRTDGADPRATLIMVLVAIWALRLGLYLGWRNLPKGEDPRYVHMRKTAGSDKAFAFWSLYRVFLFQCSIAFFVSLPTQVGQIGGEGSFGVFAMVGVAIFLTGLLFEVVGDIQLTRFKAKDENRGKLMTSGLWAWTRHPNYFGDAAVWVGLTMISLESPYGYLTILSPLLMVYFLYNISGKAMMERYMQKRYPEYAAYKERTSGFFPLPPKPAADA